MSQLNRALVFVCFLVSGFCGLLYQVVWVRLAYSAFGVITPVLSVVISVFMLGLALGSWLGGRWIGRGEGVRRVSPVLWYAAAEAIIGSGSLLVPLLFDLGQGLLHPLGEMSSARYLGLSAMVLGCTILPFCVAMGLTIPFMMAFVRERANVVGGARSFSYLYLANVIGATCGAVGTAFVLVELFGFRHTLWIAGAGNVAVVAISLVLAYTGRGAMAGRPDTEEDPAVAEPPARLAGWPAWRCLGVLFTTGFCSMAMEVAWVRYFAHYIQTLTYSFASLLGTYLVATAIGSLVYRRHLAAGRVAAAGALLAMTAAAALLPVVINDNRIHPGFVTILVSIAPICGVLGYLTPKLVDEYSVGRPDAAGWAYAVNVFGCILGPLCTCYVLLPLLGEKLTLLALAAPLAGFLVLTLGFRLLLSGIGLAGVAGIAYLGYSAVVVNRSYVEMLQAVPGTTVRRDYAGTVVAIDIGQKGLFVNGQAITKMGPITKVMGHLPMAALGRKPQDALVICFGMGTTHRSLLAWGVKTTSVELVPSVPAMFDRFFADAAAVRSDPNGRIVIDDGRRFLSRTDDRFDVVTIDPPPPLETAGSSLLYSREFCQLVRERLRDDGILAHWVPGGEALTHSAVARTLEEVFPHVVALGSVEGWGIHFLCSNRPLDLDAQAMCSRIPDRAASDLLEWYPSRKLDEVVADVLSRGLAMTDLIHPDPGVVVTDDRPFNEYYLLRRNLPASWLERLGLVPSE